MLGFHTADKHLAGSDASLYPHVGGNNHAAIFTTIPENLSRLATYEHSLPAARVCADNVIVRLSSVWQQAAVMPPLLETLLSQ